MDTAVPLGIIVNELVSNSLKHAFSGRKTGTIKIKLFSEEAGDEPYAGNEPKSKEKLTKEELKKEKLAKVKSARKGAAYTLIVSDNGTGIPEEIDFENPKTLGLQLVNILVDQLDGEIKLDKSHGTEFIIGFNVKEKKELINFCSFTFDIPFT